MSTRTPLLLSLAGCMLLASCGGASSGDGTGASFGGATGLDTSFSSDGKTTTAFTGGNNAQGTSYGNAVVLQSDGKIVEGGAINDDYGMVRYNSDGTVDTAFGSNKNGIVTTNWSTGTLGSTNDSIDAMAQDSSGNLIVAGYSQRASSNSSNFVFSLMRYTANGLLDTTFGGASAAFMQPQAGNDAAVNAIAMRSDGKLVLAGYSGNTTDGTNFALGGYNSTGVVDTGFGVLGSMVFDLGTHADALYALGLQGDNKILGWGVAGNACVLARFTVDGSQLDTSFGPSKTQINAHAGTVVVPFGGSACYATALSVQADGKIVVAGYSVIGSTTKFAIARYSATGMLDDSFGDHGLTTVDMGINAEANALAVQADGKVVLAGSASSNFALVRFNANGTLDTDFGSSGKASINFSTGTTVIGSVARSVAIQPDGLIVLAGNAGSQFAVARYKP